MTLLISIGLVATLAAIFLTFLSWRWSAGVAMAGFLLVYLGSEGSLGLTTLLFWGVAALLVLALNVMLPPRVAKARTGMGYIAGGALVGLVTGFLIAPSWIVLGCILGAVLGSVAYSMTPAGRILEFPSSKFIQYLCAKGLPVVVTLSIAAFSVLEAVYAYQNVQ